MPFMCAICRDTLDKDSTNLDISEDKELVFSVVTSCGHLFHYDCLPAAKFTVSKGGDGKTKIAFLSGEKMKCGTCSVDVTWIMRIYPAVEERIDTDEDLSTQERQREELYELRARNRALEMKMKKGIKALSNQNNTPAPVVQIDTNTSVEIIPSAAGGRVIVGSRVVWCIDSFENGIVKWLGEINHTQYAGVEFEQRIGNYVRENSSYPDIKFKEGHGRLVRLRELLTHSDFYSGQ